MAKYRITLRGVAGAREVHEVSAENIHVVDGAVKLLNGKGPSAVLVAFYNAADLVSVVLDQVIDCPAE